jgi:hypothetical protein
LISDSKRSQTLVKIGVCGPDVREDFEAYDKRIFSGQKAVGLRLHSREWGYEGLGDPASPFENHLFGNKPRRPEADHAMDGDVEHRAGRPLQGKEASIIPAELAPEANMGKHYHPGNPSPTSSVEGGRRFSGGGPDVLIDAEEVRRIVFLLQLC